MSSDTKREDLRAKLSPIQYAVTQEASTEAPFTGAYWDHHGEGTYRCIVCGEPLFDSGTKFESGTGWPSFYDVLERVMSRPRRIGPSGCGAPRSPAAIAVRTSATCSRTGRARPACAIASTPQRSTSLPEMILTLAPGSENRGLIGARARYMESCRRTASRRPRRHPGRAPG